jgi:hypothetical protein
MARPKILSLLSIDALFKLRDDVMAAIASKADALKKELAAIGSDYARVDRIAIKVASRSRAARRRSSTGTSTPSSIAAEPHGLPMYSPATAVKAGLCEGLAV